MLCGSLEGRDIWGRMDIYICMAESAVYLKLSQCCLLTGYIYKIKREEEKNNANTIK